MNQWSISKTKRAVLNLIRRLIGTREANGSWRWYGPTCLLHSINLQGIPLMFGKHFETFWLEGTIPLEPDSESQAGYLSKAMWQIWEGQWKSFTGAKPQHRECGQKKWPVFCCIQLIPSCWNSPMNAGLNYRRDWPNPRCPMIGKALRHQRPSLPPLLSGAAWKTVWMD